jgi:hypothetical protein
MQSAGDRFERLGHPRTRGGHEARIQDGESPLADGGQLARTRVRAEPAEGDAAVRRGEVDLWIELRQPLEVERLEARCLAADAPSSGPPDEIAGKRPGGHGHEEPGVDEHRRHGFAGDPPLDRGDPFLEPAGEAASGDRLADEEPELDDRPLGVVYRVCGLLVERRVRSLLREGYVDGIGRPGRNEEIGLELHDLGEVDLARDARHLAGSGGRSLHSGGNSDEPRADSEPGEDLGAVGRERDDSLRSRSEDGPILASAPHGDRILDLEQADRLIALAAAGREERRRQEDREEPHDHEGRLSGSIQFVRYFSPEEANAELEEVRPLVERLVEARRESLRLEERLGAVRARVLGNGGGLDPARVEELQAEAMEAAKAVLELLERLDQLGVQIKDPDTGLIDFPAKHPDGSDVLLCWQLGEDDVAFWHTLDGGFRGRKPLPFGRT